jgi:hypothetical protein
LQLFERHYIPHLLVLVAEQHLETTYDYDDYGRRYKVTTPNTDPEDATYTKTHYDAYNNVLAVTVHNSSNTVLSASATKYDHVGRAVGTWQGTTLSATPTRNTPGGNALRWTEELRKEELAILQIRNKFTWKTFRSVGVLIIMCVSTGMRVLWIPDYWQSFAKGIVLIGTIAVYTLITKKVEKGYKAS